MKLGTKAETAVVMPSLTARARNTKPTWVRNLSAPALMFTIGYRMALNVKDRMKRKGSDTKVVAST
jgi:hypothetical protein